MMTSTKDAELPTSTNYNRLDDGDGGGGVTPAMSQQEEVTTADMAASPSMDESMDAEKLEQGQSGGGDGRVLSFSDRVLEAAVQAELVETYHAQLNNSAEMGGGAHMVEQVPASAEIEAKSHVMVRAGRILLGFCFVLLGILALPLPGPGWLIIIAGLTIWAQDFMWAARVVSFIRRSIPGLPEEDQNIPCHVWVVLGVSTAAITAFSIWWCLYNGQATVYGWF